MAMPERWRRDPKPDPAVADLVAALNEALAKGKLRAVAIITMNPNLEVECAFAGLTDTVRRRLISSGLNEAALKALNPE